MKKKKVLFKDIFTFAFLTIVTNMCATFMIGVFAKYVIRPLGINVFTTILMWFSIILIAIGVPIGILGYYYLKTRVAFQYQPSENKWRWIKSACKLMLPVEILRFLLCLSKLGLLNSFGMMSFVPSFLYEQTYLIWSGRTNDIRHFGNTEFVDYLAFVPCYLIYAIFYLGILFWLYHYYWKKESTAYNEMLRHETDKRFY